MTSKPYRVKDIDGDYRRQPKTNVYCARCQKDLKPGQARRGVHLVDGAGFVLHPEDEASFAQAGEAALQGDLGFFLVGMDCARKVGLEWTHPVKAGEHPTENV